MPSPQSLSVLVVDDQESMCMIMQNQLNALGIKNICRAASVVDAIELLKKKKVDLVFSDFNMENGSGLDLLQHVRAHPLTRKLPFIMVTGNADADVVTSVMQAGVNGYVVKPVSASALRQRIEKALGPLR